MPSIEQLNQCLPQTQCTLCGYQGCLPYAKALAEGEAPIDRCAPGGLKTLHALAKHLKQDSTPYEQTVSERIPPTERYWIDPTQCIGCTKCIQACPVGAISGVAKHLHQIDQTACSRCDLCVPSCPVDCIEHEITPPYPDTLQPHYRALYEQRHLQITQWRATKKTQAKRQHQQSKDRLKALLDAS